MLGGYEATSAALVFGLTTLKQDSYLLKRVMLKSATYFIYLNAILTSNLLSAPCDSCFATTT